VNNFDFTANLYRPPARRQSSTTSIGSQPEQQQQRPANGRLVKQHSQGHQKPKMCEAATQTFSTGEIQVLQVYYDT
jgi:hypothetical protein